MRVAVKIMSDFGGMASMQRIWTRIYEALSDRHECVFLPHDYPYKSPAERQAMAEAFLRDADVFVGLADEELFAARQRLQSRIPFVIPAMGMLPIGGWYFRSFMGALTSNDVLLVACSSDVELARTLFTNVQARIAPFAYDREAFYPIGEADARAARQAMGFGEKDRILLYVGRILPEKNVQALLRIFSVLSRRFPDLHLVLAGDIMEGVVLRQCRVHAPRFSYALFKAVEKLELPTERLHLMGNADARRLRELYNIADVKVNMTLNPDENFGLAQVEAMVCGTPVVGTTWGGLKDTIVDGETGYRVSAVPTPTGFKVDWWEAANRIAFLLENAAERERMRERCLEQAGRYSREGFGELVESIVSGAHRDRDRPAQPLAATKFAEEFWAGADPNKMTGAAFREGAELERLFRSLLVPYSGASAEHVPATEPPADDQVLSLATAVSEDTGGSLRADNLLHPFRIRVPAAHQPAVRAILTLMRDRPALTVGELKGTPVAATPGLLGAVAWLLEQGLVMRTRPAAGWMPPAAVDKRAGRPLFAVQEVDREATDVLVF